ncbi:MFS transporter [Collinsella sp. zg1085]|uniref:MFS transporter n=1 Tax=Collinsella sp. zg1085 TaxID=2844380 RepID=UPI001C0AD350|nr:MFS transporter [Collinsella sp. zg1085]QWT17236.1 MFS transporter [Collinsella sp. zg1085]
MDSRITLQQWIQLIGLSFSAFIFNTSEFMPIGLLTDIGTSFGLNEAEAGLMVSVYAWGVMVLSLPLMIGASRIELKRLMIGVVAVFSAGQLLSAVAPSFMVLVLARLVVASAHAIFWSIAAIMATRLVDSSHAALAVSMIATGSSIAMIFGLPIGRAIGLWVGWRMTFTIVGIVALLVCTYQAVTLPRIPATEPFRIQQLPSLFKNKQLIAIYVITLLFASAYYTGYSYIEPYLAQVGHHDPSVITMVLTIFGIAGLLGSAVLSRLYDRRRLFFALFCIAGVVVSLGLMLLAVPQLETIIVLSLLWGACGTMYSIAFQSEVIRASDEESSAVAMSIFSGIYNLGIGSGTALGGAIVVHIGIAHVGHVGALIGAGALLSCWLMMVRPEKRQSLPAA